MLTPAQALTLLRSASACGLGAQLIKPIVHFADEVHEKVAKLAYMAVLEKLVISVKISLTV